MRELALDLVEIHVKPFTHDVKCMEIKPEMNFSYISQTEIQHITQTGYARL